MVDPYEDGDFVEVTIGLLGFITGVSGVFGGVFLGMFCCYNTENILYCRIKSFLSVLFYNLYIVRMKSLYLLTVKEKNKKV